jgi:signal-transduction protein with cAMP-binding, CBS, and nucleotidyltransferase domain
MRGADVERLVRGAKLRYFAPGETIVSPGPDRPADCYVIRQGLVHSVRDGPKSGIPVTREFSAGQMFPLAAHIARRGTYSTYTAVEDTFCLAFAAKLFDELIAASPVVPTGPRNSISAPTPPSFVGGPSGQRRITSSDCTAMSDSSRFDPPPKTFC